MKCNSAIKLIGMIACLFSFQCSRSQNTPTAPTESVRIKTSKILIVYLSRTNNTKAIAEIIQKQVGGLLVPLELKNPYPENYRAIVEQVTKEDDTGYLPPLKTVIANIQQYDVIFVGFPTWGMRLPPPMKSFLNQYDLKGKTVVPFNTNAGYGVGNTFATVKELCPNSMVLDGFSIQGGIERDGIKFVMEGDKAKQAEDEIKKWLVRIKLK